MQIELSREIKRDQRVYTRAGTLLSWSMVVGRQLRDERTGEVVASWIANVYGEWVFVVPNDAGDFVKV